MKRILLLTVASNMLISSLMFAQAGRTGLSFLKIGVGGRALAMGEAYSAAASDPTAVYYNPAALSLSSFPQIIVMHREWIQDTKTDFLAAKTSIDKLSLAVGVNQTSVSNIEIRTTPGPSLGTFSSRNAAIGFSAAYAINPSLNIGFTGNYLYEKIYTEEATGFGANFGALYTTPWDVRLAFAVSNVGKMNELQNTASKLPTSVRVGGAYEKWLENVDGTLTAAADIVTFTGESKSHVHLGAEFDYKKTFDIRAGYQTGYDAKNVSAGVGVRYNMFRLDYAFVPFKYDLGSTHTISLGIDFQ